MHINRPTLSPGKSLFDVCDIYLLFIRLIDWQYNCCRFQRRVIVATVTHGICMNKTLLSSYSIYLLLIKMYESFSYECLILISSALKLDKYSMRNGHAWVSFMVAKIPTTNCKITYTNDALSKMWLMAVIF